MKEYCPGCFKEEHDVFCGVCRRRLFGGKKVSPVLPFSRPAYDRMKLDVTPDRMSISGIQTKIPLALNHGKLEMVRSGGQYILKPIPHGPFERMEAAPINEHLTMQIAHQVFNIEVAANALVRFEDGEYAYIVRRFDVQSDGTRSLQEDFAQIAARSEESHGSNYKYDMSYEEIGGLIRRYVAAYPVDLERFFKLVAFNCFVNNGDAHAKNFSLIRNEETGEYNLTPAYDLLNTRLHLPNETRTALPLFEDDFETESYKANAFYAFDDFAALAQRLGLVETRYRRVLQAFIDKQDAVESLITRSRLPKDCKQAYKDHVKDRVRAFSHSYVKASAKWEVGQSKKSSE